jgi:tyrosine-protein kinase
LTAHGETLDAKGIREALAVLQRRWPLVVVCLVLVTGAAIAYSLLQEKQYTASAQLLFQDQTFDQELFNSTVVEPNVDPTEETATNDHMVQLPIISQRTANAIGGITPGEVQDDVNVSAVGQTNVAEINATDPSPTLAAKIANTYATQYVLFRQEADRAQIIGAQKLIQNELAKLTPAQRTSQQGLSLSNRGQELQILASLQTGNAEFVQPATVPSSPSIPRTKRNAGIGLIVGLLFGIGLAFLLEQLDRRIRGSEDMEEAFGVPVLGVIPQSVAYETAPTTKSLPHIEGEAFALLRARLRYFNVDRELRSLLITSAAPQDGKSTVVLNLACAEAMAGYQNVVLVEADLRRPTLSKKLGIRRGPGLAEVLSGSVALGNALQRVPIANGENGRRPKVVLSVITAGEIPPNPAELVESQAMVQLLETLTDQFDSVLIDSPPASSVSDAMHLMRLTDGVIVVSRVGKNTRDMARHLREQLTKLNAPILGVVANGVTDSDRGYAGYAYYGSYAYSSTPDRTDRGALVLSRPEDK